MLPGSGRGSHRVATHPQPGYSGGVTDAPQEFSELNADERSWLDSLVAELASENVGIAPEELAAYFDEQWQSWTATAVEDRADPNPIVNRIGAGLGEYLAAEMGLRWMVITDDFGSDLVVRREASNLVLFPMSSVAKRWESGELGWLDPFAQWVITQSRDGAF